MKLIFLWILLCFMEVVLIINVGGFVSMPIILVYKIVSSSFNGMFLFFIKSPEFYVFVFGSFICFSLFKVTEKFIQKVELSISNVKNQVAWNNYEQSQAKGVNKKNTFYEMITTLFYILIVCAFLVVILIVAPYVGPFLAIGFILWKMFSGAFR